MIISSCDTCSSHMDFKDEKEQIIAGWLSNNNVVTCLNCRFKLLEGRIKKREHTHQIDLECSRKASLSTTSETKKGCGFEWFDKLPKEEQEITNQSECGVQGFCPKCQNEANQLLISANENSISSKNTPQPTSEEVKDGD